MSGVLSMIIDSIIKAFDIMISYEIAEGVNLLTIFISILVIGVLLDVVIIRNSNKGGKSD